MRFFTVFAGTVGSGVFSYTIKPVVECNLVPEATDIPRGGTLGFQATFTNNTNKTGSVLFATKVTLPNGNRYPASG